MSLFHYTFHPTICTLSKPTTWDILKIFLLYVVILLIIAPFIFFIQKIIDCRSVPIGNSMTFLYAVIIAPVAEEILFRLPLRLSKFNYNLFFATILGYLIFLIIKTNLILFAFLLVYFLFFIFIRFYSKKDIYTLYFKYIYWLSVLSFGFLHLNNHPTVWYYMILFAPILCLPQIILGSITGYVRMKYGFIYCVIIHIANNLPLYLYYHFH